jgi:hypothetical protein
MGMGQSDFFSSRSWNNCFLSKLLFQAKGNQGHGWRKK